MSRKRFLVALVALLPVIGTACFRRTRLPIQTGPPVMQAIGDSLSEGVQSADANRETQAISYASLIALQMRGSFPLPLIQISPVGVVGSTFLRHRIHLDVIAADLGVSGATVSDTLSTSSQNGTNHEYDLVLSPRTTTEIAAAEANPAPLILYWAGSNDVIDAVLSFDELDGTQITPETTFRTNITQAMDKLKALRRPVVVGNIPDVTHIAFVMGPKTLERFAGSDFGLPEGSYTTLITAALLRLGFEDSSVLQNPDYVLDPGEISKIRQTVQTFNSIITSAAANAGFPVVDIYSYFEEMMAHPPVYGGVTLTQHYLGGLFSLDGIHPSDISYALLADQFIQVINARYASSGSIPLIPRLTQKQLDRIARHDPFIDHNGNGQVKGRFGAGLLETLAPLLRIKHDAKLPHGPTERRSRAIGEKFMAEYRKRMQQNPQKALSSRAETYQAMRHIFGLDAVHVQ
jgi:lysophospholipase L1-like esterase